MSSYLPMQPLGHQSSSGIDQSVLSGKISAIADSTESFMRSKSDIRPSSPTGVGGVSSISSGGVQLSQMASINGRGQSVKFWAHICSLHEMDLMLSLLDFPFTICLCTGQTLSPPPCQTERQHGTLESRHLR